MMSRLRSVITRTLGRDNVAEEMEEELCAHIALRADDLERAGWPRDVAERRARIDFGARERIKEESYRAAGGNWMETIAKDARYGLRMLRKSPGFTLVAVATLALAIGANAVVFSILNALVLRPVNVPDGPSLYQIEQAKDHVPSQSYPDYIDLRDRNRSFDGLALYDIDKVGLDTNGSPAPAWIYDASSNYFDVLRVQPYLGRFFHAADEHGFNSMPWIVLSYAYWQTRFHADPNVVGRPVRVNNHTMTVLGVAPKGFRGTELFYAPDFWVPGVELAQLTGGNALQNRGARGMLVVGHLKPGVTVTQAAQDLNGIAAYLSKTYPADDGGMSLGLTKPGLYGNLLGGPVHAFVAGLMLLSTLILLAACANLGSLFAARASDRWREVSLRLALGSTRGRILRQLLMEAGMVSVGGALLGIAGAVTLLRWLSAWQPIPDIPINVPVNPDARTYLVALALALVSGLLFGMVPVRQVMRANPYQGIKAGSAGMANIRRFTLRDVLLVLQVTACAVLVTSSLVAVRGMVRSLHASFGFDPQDAMQVNTDLSMSGYKGDQVPVVQRRLLDAIQGIPGVTAAAYADRIPLNLGWSDSTVYPDSATDYKPSNSVTDAMEYKVSPGYFEAAATRLLAGRSFTWDDGKGKPMVAVVNAAFARKVFGSEQKAMGRWFKIWGGTRVQVVGIAEEGKYMTLSEEPTPAMFLSILQSSSDDTWFLVRTNRGTDELGPALEKTLNSLNTGLPFVISTWDRELGTALFAARAASLALGVLGGLGAMLAITGIFGLGAYTVSKRLRELGIRIALGAQRREVLKAALGRVFRLLAIGSAAGLALGLAATKLLAYIVYQASPGDPLVLGGVIVAMAVLGVAAAWIPAMRALRADPLILLREE
ncbi:MAG TPA: ABC transporter permease [Terracidiphilus sp.]|nr:ABC transporter permease [Terracidiphilus sp.]